MRAYLCWDSTVEETEEDTVVSQFFKEVDRDESESRNQKKSKKSKNKHHSKKSKKSKKKK